MNGIINSYFLRSALLIIGVFAWFPVSAVETWRSAITAAAEKTAATSFSAKMSYPQYGGYLSLQKASTEPLTYEFQITKRRPMKEYHYLVKDGNLYCAPGQVEKSKRIAINEVKNTASYRNQNNFTILFPQKIGELLGELSNLDYTDLGEVTFNAIPCHGYQIEFYDTPDDLKKIHEVLWQDIMPLTELKAVMPDDPYYLIPIKYDLFIGKKDGFLYGWRIYNERGQMTETAFDEIVWNPDFPPGTFSLPEDCEIETIDDEEELEIFFKTQRTSLSKRITTKTLRFFSTNGVYLVLGLSLLLISTAVMIRKVRNARR